MIGQITDPMMGDMQINRKGYLAIRLKSMDDLQPTFTSLKSRLSEFKNKKDKPIFEIHTWAKMSPFSKIANMIDLMTLFIEIMLVSIVLVSIMNVMIMSVYERINEIGTIAAIGTQPGRIMSLFVTEDFLLGVLGTLVGVVLSLAAIAGMNSFGIRFDFGRQEGLLLNPSIAAGDVMMIVGIVIAIAAQGRLQPAWKAAKCIP